MKVRADLSLNLRNGNLESTCFTVFHWSAVRCIDGLKVTW